MITLHIEAETPEKLRDDTLRALGFDPDTVRTMTYGLSNDEVQERKDFRETVTAAVKQTGEEITVYEELAAAAAPADPPKPRGRRKKAEPVQEVLPPETTGPSPSFLDEPTEPAADVKIPDIEEVRDAIRTLAKAPGGMEKVRATLSLFKSADGKPCAKAPEILETERAEFIQACKEAEVA
jgi:hypothetical protein